MPCATCGSWIRKPVWKFSGSVPYLQCQHCELTAKLQALLLVVALELDESIRQQHYDAIKAFLDEFLESRTVPTRC